jgi:hypothetical protein
MGIETGRNPSQEQTMKHERLRGSVRTVFRSTPVLVFGLCAAAALAYTVHGRQASRHHHRGAPFILLATPRSTRVVAGGTVRYSIVIQRGFYGGKVKLIAGGEGLGLRPAKPLTGRANKITFRVRGQRVLMTVRTSVLDPARKYSIRIRAVGGRYRAALSVGLVISAPKPARFAITASFGPLWPGTSDPLNLNLTNPNSGPIFVTSLKVSLKQVLAPKATRALPCSAADFAVTQFSGHYPLRVRRHATFRLSQLRVISKEPRLTMLDRPVNQDGCQGARLMLSYSGTAVRR